MPVVLTSPQPLQVVQRSTVSPAPGQGELVVSGHGAPAGIDAVEVRTVALSEAWGAGTDWQRCSVEAAPGGAFSAAATVGAGGWFRLDVRLLAGGRVVEEASVEPVGVGEVFVVAGQSYAVSCHEAVLTVADPLGRATATSPEVAGWRVAHDPQPQIATRVDEETLAEQLELLARLDLSFPHGPHSPFRGSIWPAVADGLLADLHVPLGLVHVAVGATRVDHWRRGTQLFANLCDGVRLAGDVRAVLWQQGESDAMAQTSTSAYRDALRALRDDVAEVTGLDRPWVVAKSTHHPTSLTPAEDEDRVRAAVDALWNEPGFVAGPDTDTLRGDDHRAPFHRGGHLTRQGQLAAGAMWASCLLDLLRSTAGVPA